MRTDHKQHFLGGIAITLAGFGPAWGLAAGVVVGILKEVIYDWLLKRGTPEVSDAVWSLVAYGVWILWI